MNSHNTNTNKQLSAAGMSIITIMYYSLICVGAILMIVTFKYNSIACALTAYFLVASGVLLMLGVLLYRMFSIPGNNPGIFKALLSLIPIITLILIVIYSLYILTKFQDRITNGNVTSVYGQLYKTSSALIIMELIIFYFGSQKEVFKRTSMLDNVFSLLMLLIEVLNIVILVYLGVNLTYFVTDG